MLHVLWLKLAMAYLAGVSKVLKCQERGLKKLTYSCNGYP